MKGSDELQLRPPVLADQADFMAAVAEFHATDPFFDFALGLERCANFADYLRVHERWSRGEDLPVNFVPGSFFVGVVRGQVVGRLSIRHQLNPFLSRIGGHIGYGVRPSFRRRGYATAMLRQSLPICAALGLPEVLLTCDTTNLGSAKVIEACGGRFERITNYPELAVQKRRYWISTRPVA